MSDSDSDWDAWADGMVGMARAESLGSVDLEHVSAEAGMAFRQQLMAHPSALGGEEEPGGGANGGASTGVGKRADERMRGVLPHTLFMVDSDTNSGSTTSITSSASSSATTTAAAARASAGHDSPSKANSSGTSASSSSFPSPSRSLPGAAGGVSSSSPPRGHERKSLGEDATQKQEGAAAAAAAASASSNPATRGAQNEPHKQTAAEAQEEEEEDKRWTEAMEAAGQYESECFKDEAHPVWRQAARMAQGYVVVPLTTSEQRQAVVKFLQDNTPRSDGMLSCLVHGLFGDYKWYVLAKDGKAVRGVMAVGGFCMEPGEQHISAFTADDTAPSEACHLLDAAFHPQWTAITFFALPADNRAHLITYLEKERGWGMHWEHPCQLYILPREVHLVEFQVGETIRPGLRLDWLHVSDAATIDSHWPYRSARSLHLVTRLLEFGPGVGVRTAEGQLVCWIVFYHYGSIGMLHTVDEFRRQGLARAVVSALCAHLRVVRPDVLPFCHIVNKNSESRKLFESLGFVIAGTADWSRHIPKKE